MVKSSQCCKEVGLKKGPWKPEEDQKLLAYIEQHGHGSWRTLPAKAGLQRCGKSCRLRWTNYLRPDIRRGKFSLQEEQTIIQLHALLGNRWSAIASQLSKRTDNEIKNYWNTHLKKKLTKMGIDPMTHKPKSNALLLGRTEHDIANLHHIAQWESARVEAEARLVKESKLSISSSSSSSKYLPPPRAASNQPTMATNTTMLPCLDILKAWQSVAWSNNNYNNHNVGTLESPTSVLHNTSNTAYNSAAAAAANCSNYSLYNSVFVKTAMKTTNNWKCLEEGNTGSNNHDQVDDVMQILHGIHYGSNLPVVHDIHAPVPTTATTTCLPSFPEEVLVTTAVNDDDHNHGGDDLLLDDDDMAGIFSNVTGLYAVDDNSSGGNLEDNNKYWKY